MTTGNMLTPKQAAAMVDIPTRSLRRWAKAFESALSEGARQKKGRRRSYDGQDVKMLLKAKELLSKGMSLEQVASGLPVRQVGEEPSALVLSTEANLAVLQAVNQSARALERIDHVVDQVGTVADQVDDQNERLKQLEAWLRQPWWRRLFTQPKDERD